MDESLPYRVAYSDGDEQCQKCQEEIGFGCLQVAIMIQSIEADCQCPTWYHQRCFFKTRLPPTAAGFDGFAQLRYKHQEAIKKNLGINDIDNESPKTAAKNTVATDFSIEYTKSVRDSCKDCTQQFKMGEIRIMRFVLDENNNQNDEMKSGQANWFHVDCFERVRSEISWFCSGSLLPGFNRLSNDDKEMIENRILPIKPDDDTMALDKAIRFQNEEYFKVYDYVTENVSKSDQIKILNFNGQMVPSTDEQVTHHLVDVICFGALKPCNTCKRGQFQFRNWNYKCTNASEWTTCGNVETEPDRHLLKIPFVLSAKYPFLGPHCKVRKRALHSFKFVDEHGNDLVYGPYKKPLLFNMEFVLIGKLKQERDDIEQLIKKLGGKIGTEIHDRVAAIISTKNKVRKMGKRMKKAKKYSIQVVSEIFLDKIQKPGVDPIWYIISKSISNWAGDPYARIEQDDGVTQHDAKFYTKSLPEKITHKWKDGGVVDPESGLEENAKVFSIEFNKEKLFYSVILGFVDIEHNKNSYYRMQLLESNDQSLYWVFEAWGRIGTVIGSNRKKMYGNLDDALEKFRTIYSEKTGNSFNFNNFGSMAFQKQPKKFYRLDVEIGVPREIPNTFIATKLDAPVLDLMQMLFDITKMENLMCSCDLDLKQMPLGKISAKQIKMAMSALYSIAKLIQRNASVHELRDASNKFYTLIPHALGVSRPQIIDSMETIRTNTDKLESLLNMETIYSFLEGENGEEIHPLDACYHKLKAIIVPIAKDSAEFQQLSNIVSNTHGPTHKKYGLEVLEIFKVGRDGEDDRFQHQLSNHQLLWHGSRLMNFANILSNGLKIAPPEAPVTGYNFGKGIYFADVVSKSAHYCFTDRKNDTGLMLMCEVALGNSMQLTQATQSDMNIPNDSNVFQSVKGVGQYFPSQYQFLEGIVAPFYGISASPGQCPLHYNEFIVYNPNQVKIKYLFKMKFHFK